MKHPKFKYHIWNKIRNFMKNPFANKNYFALLEAWFYFEMKEYERK